jgi:hypothetical protein
MDGSAVPTLRVAVHVHYRLDHDLVRGLVYLIHHAVRETVKLTAPITFIHLLPGIGMFEDSLNRVSKLGQELVAQTSANGFASSRSPSAADV